MPLLCYLTRSTAKKLHAKILLHLNEVIEDDSDESGGSENGKGIESDNKGAEKIKQGSECDIRLER